MKKILLLILIFGIFISCKKDNSKIVIDDKNFLIFGHFYGECFGEKCVETYKLTDKKLFEDTIDDYSGRNLNFIESSNDKFEEVKDLIDFFPNELLESDKSIFGCPDCADGGGLFIQYSENGKLKTWRIDQDKKNVPSYLHSFIDKVNDKIRILNK
nr:hypothetical protein [uncultured Pedobacter sp.]